MALRTFRSNPSLGGFGSGEADGDVFCQVLKELVDNAFDACTTDGDEGTIMMSDDDLGTTTTTKTKKAKRGASRSTSARQRRPSGANASNARPEKRVRVVIEPLLDAAAEAPAGGGGGAAAAASGPLQGRPVELRTEELLRVTVTDNGVGMKDIQACVDPFSTSKGGRASVDDDDATTPHDRSKPAPAEQATAGRYGIGLTLCLLHTQRLVPNSCAILRSATAQQKEWTQVTCVVETDRVNCVQCHRVPKSQAEESGTTISILVPGGDIAVNAYHRLAEYFSRFNLSRRRTCALEIFASTLSSVPLRVRPVSRAHPVASDRARGARARARARARSEGSRGTNDRRAESEDLRESTRRGMELYLERPVKLENVAHVMVPIRFHSSKGLVDGRDVGSNRNDDAGRPVLEVAFVVDTAPGVDDAEDVLVGALDSSDCGNLALIRMVNGVPLLDTSEAVACGFVQGLVNKKRVWSSFGLAVSHRTNDTGATTGSFAKAPAFCIRDSDQVAPFFQRGAHALFLGDNREEGDDSEGEYDLAACEPATHRERRKRKSQAPRDSTKSRAPQLLPAKVRLANCFCVLQIHAKPSTLPLPTLSKGRLPLDNIAIDQALEVGLSDCLRQLQKSNPTLLLTSSQLRVVERDFRYVPQISEALARMVVNCPDPSRYKEVASTISSWDDQHKLRRPLITELSRDDDDESTEIHPLMKDGLSQAAARDLIETRLGLALSSAGTKKKRAKTLAAPLRKGGLRTFDESHDENGDPNQVLDRCTRWADAFGDLQESDEEVTESHGESRATRQRAFTDQDDDDDDDWL